ncbi:MAG: ABC transporter permease [Bradyrhizobiaceae bacterium]|nr:ABC transporter permease [Bradyrhizobiaceae bacterium]
MAFVASQAINGLVLGMLLFMLAAGLSLIFGLMNVVSLVHGSFFMIGGFLGLELITRTENFWLALILAPLIVFFLGAAVEKVFLRPVYHRGHLDQVLLTFGLSLVFLDLVQWIWGSHIHSIAVPPVLDGSIRLLDGALPIYRVFLIGFGLLLAVALWLTLERSRLGAMVRASVDDRAMAAGLGINVGRLFTGVFAAGAALAALAGVSAGPVLGVYPGIDAEILIPAFIVIVIGGMGNLRGAFVGSLLIGEADVFGKIYLPETATSLIYLVMIIVLLIRPSGLFGIVQGGQNQPPAEPRSVVNAVPTLRPVWSATILLALLVWPLVAGTYYGTMLAEVLIFAMFAMSLDLLLGYTGLISFGHAAFFGLGAYTIVLLNVKLGIDPWAGYAAGIAVATVGAALIGSFCIRAGGFPFLMLTMAFSQMLYAIASKWRDLTGGTDGIGGLSRPEIFGWSLSDPFVLYYFVAALFVLVFLTLRMIVASPLGHAFVGIRENEARMRAIGYPTLLYRTAAFTIGGAVAGLAGCTYALFNAFVSPDLLFWTTSGDVLIMTVLGGAGSLVGPVIGTGIFMVMKNVVSSHSDRWMMIIGFVVVICVLFFNEGVYGAFMQFKARFLPRFSTRLKTVRADEPA